MNISILKKKKFIKIRSYYLYNYILKYILIYKDNFKLKKKIIKNLLLNFNIIKENNNKFIDTFLNVILFLKLFSIRFSIKNIINGNLTKYFKNYYLNFINPNLSDGIFSIIQIILKKKKIFIFLEYILKFLTKNKLKNKKYYHLKYLQNLNFFFIDLTGLLSFKFLYNQNLKYNKPVKSINNSNINFFILYFIINIYFFFND